MKDDVSFNPCISKFDDMKMPNKENTREQKLECKQWDAGLYSDFPL